MHYPEASLIIFSFFYVELAMPTIQFSLKDHYLGGVSIKKYSGAFLSILRISIIKYKFIIFSFKDYYSLFGNACAIKNRTLIIKHLKNILGLFHHNNVHFRTLNCSFMNVFSNFSTYSRNT